MAIRFKTELRKVAGLRFVRFKLLDRVDTDSAEEIRILAALRVCGIEAGDHTGLYKNLDWHDDGSSGVCVGGVDIPIAAIEDFTAALTGNGFEVV